MSATTAATMPNLYRVRRNILKGISKQNKNGVVCPILSIFLRLLVLPVSGECLVLSFPSGMALIMIMTMKTRINDNEPFHMKNICAHLEAANY